MTNLTNKINCLRRDIAHTDLIIKCTASNNFTNNQNHILKSLKKKFGNTKVQTLSYNLNLLKHELKTKSVRLNYHRKTNERKRINRQFSSKPNAAYCLFGVCSVIPTPLPRKFQPAKKWSPTGPRYEGKANYNNDAPWIKSLQNEYCSYVIQDNNCSITIAMLEKAITRLQDNKSPGNDLIVGYWYKDLKFYINELILMGIMKFLIG